MQGEHEAQVVGQPGEERHLGRAGVREDRRQLEPAQHVERRGAHGVLAGHGANDTAKRLAFCDPVSSAHGDGTPTARRPGPALRRPAPASRSRRRSACWLEQQQLQTGERIGTEQELADEFGVSRPTMREALRLLSAAHLIRVGRGRSGGIFVARTPSEGMSRNLVGVDRADAVGRRRSRWTSCSTRGSRSRSRSPAARRSTPTTASSTASSRRSTTPTGHQPGTRAVQRRRQRASTQILAEASGNELLHALTGWILEVLQPSLIVTISPRVDPEAILAQHRAILRAVRRRQRLAAEKAMAAAHRVPRPDPRRGRVTLVGFLGLGELADARRESVA